MNGLLKKPLNPALIVRPFFAPVLGGVTSARPGERYVMKASTIMTTIIQHTVRNATNGPLLCEI
jgi:hypothetical protein